MELDYPAFKLEDSTTLQFPYDSGETALLQWYDSSPKRGVKLASEDIEGINSVSAFFHYPGIETSGKYSGGIEGLLEEEGFPDNCMHILVDSDNERFQYKREDQESEKEGLHWLWLEQVTPERIAHYLSDTDIEAIRNIYDEVEEE